MSHRKVRPAVKPPRVAIVPEGNVAVFELASGASSVELTLDSKGAAKPSVKVYHRDPAEVSRIAEELFDGLICKYVQVPADVAKRAAAAAQ